MADDLSHLVKGVTWLRPAAPRWLASYRISWNQGRVVRTVCPSFWLLCPLGQSRLWGKCQVEKGPEGHFR